MERIVKMVEMTESMFNTYDCEYCFEAGILYNDNGCIDGIEINELRNDVIDTMEQLWIDCNRYSTQRQYDKIIDNVRIIKALDKLLDEIDRYSSSVDKM